MYVVGTTKPFSNCLPPRNLAKILLPSFSMNLKIEMRIRLAHVPLTLSPVLAFCKHQPSRYQIVLLPLVHHVGRILS